ncbi:MAG: hypothetical protein ACM30H_06255, partial [Clostridia bacterium]
AGTAFDAGLFLALWIGVVFVFFSISDSKLPSYILPLFPALALLVGRTLAKAPWGRLLALQAALAAAVGVFLVAGAPSLVEHFMAQAAPYGRVLAAAGLPLAAGAAGAAIVAWRGRQALAVAALALGSFACTLVAMLGHGAIASSFTIAPQAASLSLPREAPVFAVDYYDHTLPWYFKRLVTMVRYKDELGQPIGWEPGRFIPDLDGFAKAWRQAPVAYAVFDSNHFKDLQGQVGVPMQVVSQGPRYTIVRKP